MTARTGEVELNEAQKRALSVVLHFAEEAIERMEVSLNHTSPRLTSSRKNDLTAKEREAMRVLCGRLRAAVGCAHTALGAEVAESSLRAEIRGEASVLWATLEDTKSPGLRGYGSLSSEAANAVDSHLDDISNLMLAVLRMLGGDAGEPAAKVRQ